MGQWFNKPGSNLATIARETGFPVVEVPGWTTRGHGPLGNHVGVIVCHHTAGPEPERTASNYPSLAVVRDGRPGLEGPLAHYGIGFDATIYVFAAGLAYHAGTGGWRGLSGNSVALGIEAEDSGDGDWTAAQLDCYPRLLAVICRFLGLDAGWICGHKEWAPGRKVDPAGIDMNGLRQRVAGYLANPNTIHRGSTSAPAPAPHVPGGIESMAFNDTFTTRYNRQLSVADYMAWTDFRLNEIYRALLEPGSQPSRIPGDKNTTNLRDAVMDSTAWSNITMREVFALKAAVASLGGVDPSAVAEAMRPVLAEVVGPVVRESVSAALGEDNDAQADAIVREIAERLSGQEAA